MGDFGYKLRKQLLWLRHSYKYRWAHDPLCDRLGGGVQKIGNVYVCRSCLIVYSVAGLTLLSAIFSNSVRELAQPIFFTAAVIALALSLPQIYNSLAKPLKYLARTCLGLLLGLAPFALFENSLVVGPTLIVLVVSWRAYGRIRKDIKDKGCEGCPELELDKICSGFETQAAGARAFEEQATVLFIESGKVPI